MARKFKRGEAVMHFGQRGPTRCYFGGKMGGYRVLSSLPDVESGWCIPLEEVARAVFHAPNEHGVYPNEVCDAIEYRAGKDFRIVLRFLQIAPDAWAIGKEVEIGNGYQASPVSERWRYPSLEAAIRAELAPLLAELARCAAGAPNAYIRSESQSATRRLQRRAMDAIFHLLHGLSPHLSRDIIISLLSTSQSDNNG
ncbi:hypothetical protein FX016_22995 [Cupriavidus gilardii]|nr:hypothetical protein FX016_22995 [Cupriavidus gilardii]